MKPVEGKRLELLDAYRGLAVLLVISYHYSSRFNESFYGYSTDMPDLEFGRCGVQLFFAISGFCIALTARSTQSPFQFLNRRLSRIYPAFVLAVLLVTAVLLAYPLPGRGIGTDDIVGSLFFLGDSGVDWVDGAYWSLAAELKFYAIFALAYYRPRWILPAVAAFIAALGIMSFWQGKGGTEGILELVAIHHQPWFLLGVAMFWIYEGRRDRKVWIALVVSFVGVLVATRSDPIQVTAFLLAGLLLLVVNFLPALKAPRLLVFFGGISYPLYLVHQNIGYVAIRATRFLGSDWLQMGLAFAVAVGLALALHHSVEFRFRRRFEALVALWAARVGHLSKTW